MSIYRVCRVLLVALLVTCVACPVVARADTIDQRVEALMAMDLDAEIKRWVAVETPAAIRLTLNYELLFLPTEPVDIDLRIAGLELRIRVAKAPVSQ